MGFDTEPLGYEKTVLSELQGAWKCLRDALAENPGFDGWQRVLFHVDEAMSCGRGSVLAEGGQFSHHGILRATI